MTWHTLRTVDDEFFRTAAVRHTVTVPLNVSPEQLTSAFAGTDIYRAWGHVVTNATWQSDGPGVGAIRNVTLLWLVRLREHYSRWDPNEHFTFGADETTMPGVRAFGEDYVIEADETTPSQCRMRWTVAADLGNLPAPITRAVNAVLRASVSYLGRRLTANLRSRVQ